MPKRHEEVSAMSNPFFKFKQFTVYHDRCAMKVGTDGVLLGAWASVDGCTHLLDVGTGSGLIALMLAQRCRNAFVTAIDPDEDAIKQAEENVKASPFADRITVVGTRFQDYTIKTSRRFDLIVCNPPFFARSLLPPDAGRANARHSVSLSLEELMQGAHRCLSPEGHLALILPAERLVEMTALSAQLGFQLRRLTHVVPSSGKPVRRILAEFSRSPGEPVETELLLEVSRHHYSPAYIELVRDFYLNL